MVRIECDYEGRCSIVEGYDEFLEHMERESMVEVRDNATGKKFFAHEVGEEIYLLNEAAQETVANMANLIIQDVAQRPYF